MITVTKVIIEQDKNKIWRGQQQRIFDSLYHRPQTRLMVSKATGSPIQNTCRYIHNFKKAGRVHIVKTDVCTVSGMKAEYLSTNPAFAPSPQLKMFQ